MADQSSLNGLLQWGIANSASSIHDPTAQPTDPNRGLNSAALAELLGGPSDADRMRQAMTAIIAPLSEVNLEDKLVAWDNLEQLIEQIDNANNLESLGMWQPLIAQLDSEEPEMRKWAAWCISTAVQNNVKCQEKLLAFGAVERLAEMAVADDSAVVKKKAVSALSSEVRNFQPGLDELEKWLPKDFGMRRSVDAGDMEQVDEIMQKLRENAARG